MKINKNENVRPFDVDKCLVREETEFGDNLKLQLGKSNVKYAMIKDPLGGPNISVRVNKAMVRLLKEEHQRGGCVKVWSRSGWEWALNVVTALELTPFIDEVMSKPTVYFDDTPIQDWLKDRVFLDFDFRYKE